MIGLDAWRERHGLEGGERSVDSEVVEESLALTGAVVMGRKMYSGGEGPWEDDPNANGWWGDDPPFRVPVFVLTHHPREPETKKDTAITFVTDGIESAVAQATRLSRRQERRRRGRRERDPAGPRRRARRRGPAPRRPDPARRRPPPLRHVDADRLSFEPIGTVSTPLQSRTCATGSFVARRRLRSVCCRSGASPAAWRAPDRSQVSV